MSKVNGFTKGEWGCVKVGENLLIESHPGCYVVCDIKRANETDMQNAHLIATAGTTATKLADMGYDAVKLIEALPDIVCLEIDEDDFIDHEVVSESILSIIKDCSINNEQGNQ